MADYAKKTVAELQEILKSRGLPSSGKKAELIARLNENDQEALATEEVPVASQPEPEPIAEPIEPSTEAVIDTAPAADPIASTLEPPTDPTATVADNPSPDTALATQTNYSLNLPTSTVDSELAKRKARAERFGTNIPAPAASEPAESDTTTATPAEPPATDADPAALKNLERAKRFGTGQTAIGKLDEALPSDLARGSRKRGHAAVAEGTELDDPGLKRGFANRGRGRGGRPGGGGAVGRHRGGRGVSGGPAGAKPQGVQKGGAPSAFSSEKDRLAAEARKKKFASTA